MWKLGFTISMVTLAGMVALAACGDDETNDDNSSTSSGSGGGGGGGAGGTGGAASASGFCAWSCTTASDCCFGDPNCPGAYPSNPTCEPGGWCKAAQCSGNTECTNGGQLPDWQCFQLDLNPMGMGVFHACAESCNQDSDCDTPNTTCKGVDMNGAKYCFGDISPCTSDDQCTGIGTCNLATGTCVCQDSTECTIKNVNTCVLP